MWNSTLQRKSPMRAGTKPLQRTAWKRKAPKKRAGHDAVLRNACRGQRCYLCVPTICLGAAGADTVVPCHANWSEYGKGMGLKAADKFTVPGCMACHRWLDQGAAANELKRDVWELAYAAWYPVRDRLGAA